MITCKVTGKRYIGQTVKKIYYRFNDHKSYAANHLDATFKLPSAIRKHGIENFFIEEIEKCNEDVLNIREEYWIKYIDTFHNGLNSTTGGERPTFSEETKKKIGDRMRGKTGKDHPAYGFKHTKETKQIISEASSSRSVSEETRKKLSDSMLGEKNPWYGKNFTEEHKNKISEGNKKAYEDGKRAKPSKETGITLGLSNIGRKDSEESKAKKSAAAKGKPKSKEHNAAVSKALKGKPKSEAHKQAIREAKAKKKLEKDNAESK